MTLNTFRPFFDNVIIDNCGYNFENATQAITSKQADMIAFGRSYISNPDLPAKYQHGWSLAAHYDVTHYYGGGAEGDCDCDCDCDCDYIVYKAKQR